MRRLLENSEHVSYERLICWQEMISKTQEGQSLTQNELEYLHEIVRIAFYNHRKRQRSTVLTLIYW